MTVQRKRSHQLDPASPPPAVLPAAPPAVAGSVRVVAGADVQDMDLAGRTVGEARTIARTIFGISSRARALVDGREAEEGQVLTPGIMLEFVRHAGQKGTGTLQGLLTAWTVNRSAPTPDQTPQSAGAGSVIELAGAQARWKRGDDFGGQSTIDQLLARVAATGAPPASWRVLPRQVRAMVERNGGRTVGVVIEMPPGPRQVRWVANDSPTARGRNCRLSFPWVVLIVVFVDGELANLNQTFFRTKPIASLDDELSFTNLLNVTRGYGQESWVCLMNLTRSLGQLGWEDRIRAVTRHFWEAAYNRSADLNEGASYWERSRHLDDRVANAGAWEQATAAAPYFALDVRWRSTGRTIKETLGAMLDVAAPWRPIVTAEQLATLMQRSAR